MHERSRGDGTFHEQMDRAIPEQGGGGSHGFLVRPGRQNRKGIGPVKTFQPGEDAFSVADKDRREAGFVMGKDCGFQGVRIFRADHGDRPGLCSAFQMGEQVGKIGKAHGLPSLRLDDHGKVRTDGYAAQASCAAPIRERGHDLVALCVDAPGEGQNLRWARCDTVSAGFAAAFADVYGEARISVAMRGSFVKKVHEGGRTRPGPPLILASRTAPLNPSRA